MASQLEGRTTNRECGMCYDLIVIVDNDCSLRIVVFMLVVFSVHEIHEC